jgi:crotonobetainyl-CoA:carnitine CoA-transferase CaiB-like acyl-CoA transferase
LAVEPLAGLLVVDLTRYLPGPFASRELLGLGARVVRLEAPGGDPLRELAPAWHEALNAGKESVTCDLKADPETGRELCARADVVLESFRPGVAERLGVGAADLPETVVYCSFTGFGPDELRAGHDLNYQGYAGLLADTAPAMPPVPIADLAGGGLTAVTRILAALLERERTGRGRHVTISLTDAAHKLVSYRVGGEPVPRLVTGGLACYRIYATADARYLTVAALEPRFFSRLCDLLGRPDLTARQWDADQEPLAAELAEAFGAKPLASWLELVEGEDVGVGPVATLDEAAAQLGRSPSAAGSANRSGRRASSSG